MAAPRDPPGVRRRPAARPAPTPEPPPASGEPPAGPGTVDAPAPPVPRRGRIRGQPQAVGLAAGCRWACVRAARDRVAEQPRAAPVGTPRTNAPRRGCPGQAVSAPVPAALCALPRRSTRAAVAAGRRACDGRPVASRRLALAATGGCFPHRRAPAPDHSRHPPPSVASVASPAAPSRRRPTLHGSRGSEP